MTQDEICLDITETTRQLLTDAEAEIRAQFSQRHPNATPAQFSQWALEVLMCELIRHFESRNGVMVQRIQLDREPPDGVAWLLGALIGEPVPAPEFLEDNAYG